MELKRHTEGNTDRHGVEKGRSGGISCVEAESKGL